MQSNSRAADPSAPPELRFGTSTALSGPAAELGSAVRRGITAEFERVNRAGGVHGLKLRLIALDDGYEPSRTAPNMRKLIDEDQVLAVVGNLGTPTAVVAAPIAAQRQTLLFAPFTGAGILRETPPQRYVINYRASYAEETEAMVAGLVDELGMKPEEIALFTQRDAYGDTGYRSSLAALLRHGLQREDAVEHVHYERNTLAVEKAVATLVLADPPPRAVIMIGTYAPCAKFIKICTGAGLRPLFLNVSFVGAEALGRALGDTDAQVICTAVVPPVFDARWPILREYCDDLRAMSTSAVPGLTDLEGYISARLLTTALHQIDGPPSRESLIDALEALGDLDLGLGPPLHLSPTEHQASHQVWPTILRRGAFVPFQWTQLAATHRPSS